MHTNEIVERLLRGSHAIDRMRQDIHQTVMMICGLVIEGNHIQSLSGSGIPLDSRTCRWRISGGEKPPRAMGFLVECRVKRPGDFILVYNTSRGQRDGHFDNVALTQTVYEDLPTFVNGMVGAFPSLETKWKHFLDAAKVFAPMTS